MAEKKYQVFISSTYTDLIEERRNLLDILLMADCIPAGMEAFVATDTEQFEVIKKVIDLCDYYVLIIGRRYGSVNTKTGLSYTEMEYDYAIEKGIPVLVFAINESVELPPDKVEQDIDNVRKLISFRNRAMSNRLASIWKSSEDLTGKLAISIMQAKIEIVRPGWQRAVDYDEASFRREIMKLEEKNSKLIINLNDVQKEIESYNIQEDIAFEDTTVSIDYSYTSGIYLDNNSSNAKLKLSEIFSIFATEMMDVAITEYMAEIALKSRIRSTSISLNDKQLIKKLLNQYKVLGLMRTFFAEDKEALYWDLTSKGKKIRDDTILIKKDGN